MTTPSHERLLEAYVMMACQARYRPAAPSDGHGNIQLTREQLADPKRLVEEAWKYAREFSSEEDGGRFWVGCSDFSTNRAFVWAIEAARCLAGGVDGNHTALTLLEMAATELQER